MAIDPIRSAQARLVADSSFQFSWSAAPPPAQTPSWLEAVLRAIGHGLKIGSPYIRIGLWVLLAVAGVAVVVAVIRQFLVPANRWVVRRLPPVSADGATQAAREASAHLEEADRLAAEGLFADAAHVLLLCSVSGVEKGRAVGIRPSLTAREIAALPDLPPQPRVAFAHIARLVEQALFGGAVLDGARWLDCREAYLSLVRPEAWIKAGRGR